MPLLTMTPENPHTHGGGAAAFADAAGAVFGDPLRLMGRSTSGVAIVVGSEGALTCEEKEEGRRSATMFSCWRDGEPATGSKRTMKSAAREGGNERVMSWSTRRLKLKTENARTSFAKAGELVDTIHDLRSLASET